MMQWTTSSLKTIFPHSDDEEQQFRSFCRERLAAVTDLRFTTCKMDFVVLLLSESSDGYVFPKLKNLTIQEDDYKGNPVCPAGEVQIASLEAAFEGRRSHGIGIAQFCAHCTWNDVTPEQWDRLARLTQESRRECMAYCMHRDDDDSYLSSSHRASTSSSLSDSTESI